MKLSSILKPELIKSNCISKNLEELFSEIVDKLYTTGYIKDKELIYAKLLEREKLGSTSIGNNAAIPHAKIKGLEHTIVFIALSNDGVDFRDKLEKKPVHLIIFILSPINSPVSHLQTLAAAASLIKNVPDFFKNTFSSKSTEILDLLIKAENGYD